MIRHQTLEEDATNLLLTTNLNDLWGHGAKTKWGANYAIKTYR